MNTEYNRTFLGIDYGERRIGIAKSDPTGTIASALVTLNVKSHKDALEQLGKLIDEYEPDGIVIGYPLYESGDKSPKCAVIDRFINKLSGLFNGPINKTDERHSSVEAASVIHAHGQKTGKDKARLDRLAAVIILQRFLDEELR